MRATLLAIGLGVVAFVATSARAEEMKARTSGETEAYTGCLAKGDEQGEFKLTHVNGGAGEYELLGGKDLDGHVGHKVEIQGTLVPAEAAEGMEGEKMGEEKEEKGESEHRHLRVHAMKHVAATCP